GATSVHRGCGVFGTICVGLFAKEGVTTYSGANGLFYGGGFGLLGTQLLGIAAVGVFVFASSSVVWLVLKKTVGIRVSRAEEIAGLDIEEHGNTAYPDFTAAVRSIDYGFEQSELPVPAPAATVSEAIPVTRIVTVDADRPKFTKIEIICKESRFELLKNAMTELGITGMTVSHVLGCGQQKGRPEYYRGALLEATLLPKLQVDIVVSKIPVRSVVETAKKALYTGHIGDGKIFIYDVENVVKVRTGEEGYDALQDVE
ncbi:MAG: adenylate cyclase, partial [Oscillospiraceae bacterium]|nr:adenylate cyclase [Oscillospiraceae bacterium]